MGTELHLDWETRGVVDLRKAGLHRYAQDINTGIWIGSYAFDDEPPTTWREGDPCPPRIKKHVENGGIVWGHNVVFEIELNNAVAVKHGWAPLDIRQCRCTMACAAAMALPLALEHAAPAAGITHQKDMRGHRVMMQLSQPRSFAPDGTPIWYNRQEHPEKFEQLDAYGLQDIETERALSKRVLPLSDAEFALWCLDFEINQRGVQVDLGAAKQAIEIVEAEKKRLDAEMRRVTGGAVATCTANGQLGNWLRFRGVSTESVAKGDVIDLLAGELPVDCRAALLLRQEAAKSSTAKFSAMLNGACEDGRLRGMFQYHAASTGRWGGRRVQLQNLPRPKLKQAEIDKVFECLSATT